MMPVCYVWVDMMSHARVHPNFKRNTQNTRHSRLREAHASTLFKYVISRNREYCGYDVC